MFYFGLFPVPLKDKNFESAPLKFCRRRISRKQQEGGAVMGLYKYRLNKALLMKTSATLLLGMFAIMANAAMPTVSNVRAQQNESLDGSVDITYTITGIGQGYEAILTGECDFGNGKSITMRTFKSPLVASNGTWTAVWNAKEDCLYGRYYDAHVRLGLYVLTGEDNALYYAIDLSGGVNASSYPIIAMDGIPSGGWTEEHKTTKLVFRRIQPGSFIMGCSEDEVGYTGNETIPHRVTLTKPFFINVFEITQQQWKLVMGDNPAHFVGAMRPIENIGDPCRVRGDRRWLYNFPRMSNVDPDSFAGRLMVKTGKLFDLPLEAQWEYACRAGTITSLNSGKNIENGNSGAHDSNLAEVGRYAHNRSDGKGGYYDNTTTVGSYLPNAWGLYDMHGNVYELCLDWWSPRNAFSNDDVFDPVGPLSGVDLIVRAGGWFSPVRWCRSSYRTPPADNLVKDNIGFRLVQNFTGDMSNATSSSSFELLLSPEEVVSTNLSDGLVAHYAFDGNANDSSGNGNNGVSHFGVITTADRHGKSGGALHFDGTSGYVDVSDSDSLREVGQMITVSAWIKPEAWDNNWISILCKGHSEMCRQYGPQINKSGKWLLNYYDGTKANELEAKTIVELNTWNHVSVTYAPTLISVYLNGEFIGAMLPLGDIVANSEPLYIGIDPPGSVECFAGDMDEVRIYNRCLSASEIRALANGDSPVASDIGDGTLLYCFDVDGGVGIAQTGIGQFASALNIPDMIEGKSVVAIGRYGFADNGDIATVTIPASVSEIGDSAFAGCANLARVMLSCDIGALTVGGNAFDANTEVKIAGRSGCLFGGWTNSLGVAVTDPFHGSSTVTVAPVWRKSGTAEIDGRIWAYSVSDDGSVTIGNGIDVAVSPAPSGDLAIPIELGGCPVVGVAANAFRDCTALTSLTIPSNVTSIGIGAFDGCSGLTNIVIASEELYTAGLLQTRFDTRFDTTSTLGDATNAVSPVSGAIAAYTKVTAAPWEFSDPFTGNAYAWNEADTTFAYFGQMYLEEGKSYVFGSHFDDDAFIKVGGDVLISVKDIDTSNKQPDEVATGKQIFMGQYACMSSGWYDVEFRLSDIGLGKGPWANIWSADFGLGYRDDGGTSTTQSEWKHLLDSGDGSLLHFKGAVFAGCSNVVSVTMPWSLVTRMSTMFPDAYGKLESVVLTGDAVTIPENAFTGCASLRSFGSCSEPVVVTNFVDVVVFVTNTVTDIVTLTNIVTQTVVDTVTDYVTLTNMVVETNMVTDVVMLTNVVTQTVIDTVTDYVTLTNIVVETNFVDAVETNFVDVVTTNVVTDVLTLTNIVTQTVVDTVTDYVTLTNMVVETNFVDVVETNFVEVISTNLVTDVVTLTNIVTQTVVDTVTDYVTLTNIVVATNFVDVVETNFVDVVTTNVLTDIMMLTNVVTQTITTTNVLEIAEEAAIVPEAIQTSEPEAAFTGADKAKMNGVVFDADGVMRGIIQIETAKTSAKGVKVKGFVMLEDGKKATIKGVTAPIENGRLEVGTTVGKLGALVLSVGGDGFIGSLGPLKVVSAEIGADAGVLSGSLTLKNIDVTGKVKSRKIAVGGVVLDGTAAGTATEKGGKTKAFAAEFE